jgi:hypothetical protein
MTISTPTDAPVLPVVGVVEPFPRRKLYVTLIVIVVLAIVTWLLIVGGRRADDEKTTAALKRCTPVGAAVAAAVGARADLGPEELRSWVATPVDADLGTGFFVSAERIRPGRPRGAKGRILTWHTNDATEAGSDYESVDVSARQYSTWPHSTLEVEAPGALNNRTCVAKARDPRWHKALFGT